MQIKARLDGDKEMIAKLRKLATAYPEAGATALYEEGLALDADMVPRIPVDTGRLRASHFVTLPSGTGANVTVEVGVATDYAVPVHELTEVQHPVGESKFLEKALMARHAGMGARLGERVQALVEAENTKTHQGGTPTVPQTHTGSRGGRYRLGRGGRKIYHRRKKK